MKTEFTILFAIIFFAFTQFSFAQVQKLTNDKKPNIILINMDNFGYGELGCYGGGITRGGATPRIDKLATEGMRLTNFNVEAQCTPSRAALMTGRYAKRSGNGSIPIFTGEYGLTQWEYTMPEMLSDIGYATGMFGKWHLGHTKGRTPVDQGFDEWYGIPNSSDESFWPDNPQFNAVAKENLSPYMVPEYVYDGKKGAEPKKVKVYNSELRKELDRELTDKAEDFITRNAKAAKPFFAYIPYTLTHYPVVPGKAFEGKSGNGNWGDVLMQIDAYVAELLDLIDKLGVSNNTIFIFTSDNGPEFNPDFQGWSGPWTGSYFTPYEGSLRVPFIIRWPGKIPAGALSNEIVHEMDLYTSFAKITGGKVPTDRIIDGVDQTDFFFGKTKKSARDGFVIYVGEELFGVKWRNFKMLFKEFDDKLGSGNILSSAGKIYDLYNDPQEKYPWTQNTPKNYWARWPMAEIIKAHLKSLETEPFIKPGTPDPYLPNGK